MSVSKYISIRFSSVLCWGVRSGGLQTSGAVGVGGPVVSSSPQLPWEGLLFHVCCAVKLSPGALEACTEPSPICVATCPALAFLHPASTSVLARVGRRFTRRDSDT